MQYHPRDPPQRTAIPFKIPTGFQARFVDHPRKETLAWEAPDRLYEVYVRRAVAPEDRA